MFIVVYSKYVLDPEWAELAVTETSDPDQWGNQPVFKTTIDVQFKMERQLLLRWEVYRCRDPTCKEDLRLQAFQGCADHALIDLIKARRIGAGTGWLTQELMDPRPNAPPAGTLLLWAEEEHLSKQLISFEARGKGIMATDMWKPMVDSYLVLSRSVPCGPEGQLRCTPVYRTRVARKTPFPLWERIEVGVPQISGTTDTMGDVVVELYDWFRVEGDRYIGECTTTATELVKAYKDASNIKLDVRRRTSARIKREPPMEELLLQQALQSEPKSRRSMLDVEGSLVPDDSPGPSPSLAMLKAASTVDSVASTVTSTQSAKKQNKKDTPQGRWCGTLVIDKVGLKRNFSFLDYYRGGLEVKTVVAIDYSRSNCSGDVDAPKHHRPEKRLKNGNTVSNPYIQAIRAIGKVLKYYYTDDLYPAYGFGAKLYPSHTISSDCFALTGDFLDPEVQGMDGVVRAYQRALPIVHLHGPTRLSMVIQHIIDQTQYLSPVDPNEHLNPFKKKKEKTKPDLRFTVMVIVTDGDIHDKDETVAVIAAACELPMAISIIGVGDNDMSFLRNVHMKVREYRRNEGKKVGEGLHARDCVMFARFNDHAPKMDDLASAALARVPLEMTNYYEAFEVTPWGLDVFEDANGQPIPVDIPKLSETKVVDEGSNPASQSVSAQTSKPMSRKTSKNEQQLSVQSPAQSRKSTKLEDEGGEIDLATLLSGNAKVETVDEQIERQKREHAEQVKAKLARLSPFLKEEHDRLFKLAKYLGYEKEKVTRTLKDGIPSPTIECLVDNMMNAGYGKLPSYKEALHRVPEPAPEMDGEPPNKSKKWTDRGDAARSSSRPSTVGPLTGISRSSGSKLRLAGQVSRKNTGSPRDSPTQSGSPSRRGSSEWGTFKHMEDAPPLLPGAVVEDTANWSDEEDKPLLSPPSANKLRRSAAEAEKDLCRMCMSAPVEVEFVPCLHKISCHGCAGEWGSTCPVCQAVIKAHQTIRKSPHRR